MVGRAPQALDSFLFRPRMFTRLWISENIDST